MDGQDNAHRFKRHLLHGSGVAHAIAGPTDFGKQICILSRENEGFQGSRFTSLH